MRLSQFSRRVSFRSVVCGAALAASVAVYAQVGIHSLPPNFASSTKTYKATVSRQPAAIATVNTDDFFPQINKTVVGKKIRPAHKRPLKRIGKGLNNNLKAGGVEGVSSASSSSYFPGPAYNGWVPPDCHMAAGPTELVAVVNSVIGFYGKDGTEIFSQNAEDFFSSLSGTVGAAISFIFDPRVIYDNFNGRYIILFDTLDEATSTSYQVIAASDNNTPQGTWRFFAYNTAITIGSDTGWLDYPMLGFNQDAITVSGNMFGFSSGYLGGFAFVVPTAGLYSGSGSTMTGFQLGLNGFSVHPSSAYTTSNYIFGVQALDSTTANIYAFGNLTGVPTLTSTEVSVPAWFPAPGTVPSGGSGGGTSTVDERIMNVCFRDGYLVAGHTVNSGDNRAQARWYEFNLASWPLAGAPTLEQSGNISMPSGEHSFFPALAKNVFGDISLICSRTSSTIVSDLILSSRISSDTPGVMSQPVLLKSGTIPNNAWRWGDYFACVVDPTDDFTFWGIGEITGGISWATEIQSWTVSTGTGVDYEPSSISTFQGTYVGGNLTSVTANDSSGYLAQSVLLPGQGQYSSVLGEFFIPEYPTKIRNISFTVDSSIAQSSNATGTLFLFNNVTGKWEYVKAFPLRSQSGDAIQTFSIKKDFDNYVDPSGQIRLVLRAHSPYRRTGGTPAQFTLNLDWLRINVRSVS